MNGAAARLHFPEPASERVSKDASACVEVEPGIEIDVGKEIEVDIGAAVAAGVLMLVTAADAQCHGAPDPAAKARAADAIARISTAMLDYELGDGDFVTRARRAGLCELVRRFAGVGFCGREFETELDTLISDLFMVVTSVVTVERVYRATHAN